ncbi:MAG: hypothetical protein R3B95_07845 [Nitrospirales bacterium]|nr:hypothetical protein [Nitrospirales bacterium]
MPTHASPRYDKTELAVRNVRAFHDDNLILGNSARILYGWDRGHGHVLLCSLGFVWLPAGRMGVAYYVPMYAMHKDDPKGFTIWMAALSSRTLAWESGHTKTFSHHLFFLKQRSGRYETSLMCGVYS